MPVEQRALSRPLLRGGLTTLVAVGALALIAAPAGADPAPASAVGVGSVHTADTRDSFTVPAWTDNAGAHLTSVSAVLSLGTTTVNVTLVDPDGDGQYAPESPIVVGTTLPTLGRWSASVTATDSTGASTTRTDAGIVDVTDRPSIQTGDLHTTLATRADQHVTVTGTAYFVAPGSTTRQPLPDRTVVLSRTAAPGVTAATQTITTGTDGTFTSQPFDNSGTFQQYFATVSAADDELDGTATAAIGTSWSATQVVVTARADQTRVSDGQHFTVSGTVTASDGSGPIAGTPVSVGITQPYQDQVVVTTDSAGRFSVTLTAVANDVFGDRWGAVPTSPFLFGGGAFGIVDVPRAAALAGTHISLDGTGRVSAGGNLVHVYPGDTGYGSAEVVYLEYSANGASGWSAIGHATFQAGSPFSVAGWGYVNGWYRLRHAQSNDYEAATTAPVHLTRTVTYVFGTKATPSPIAKGHVLTVSGVLEQHGRTWTPMAHTRVYLYFLPKGGHTYQYVAQGVTDAHGHIALTGKPARDGYWQIHYFGDATHFDSGDQDAFVHVR